MRSYEQIKSERAFIHISLAHFDEQGKNASSDVTDSAKIVNDLEGKIINQLIHQIPAKNIPQSLFQLKNEVSPFKRLIIVTLLLAFGALWIYVLKFYNWVSLISTLSDGWIKSILSITTNSYSRLFGVLLIVLLSGIGLFYFFSTYSLQNIFKKVDLKGIVGLELFSAEDDTYFDKYLNKVLCLFDAADADAIVFEDLDRYDVTLIFEKLREINDLAYSRSKQGLRPKKKLLRFFYLIRDDVFTAADRSKFFDFIIPVVPYVDASNSCEQLLQRFNEAGLDNVFNKRFLQDVSLYLSDMRLITNIVNEYIIYHGQLADSGLETKSDRQLAMVIYKNIYPDDFDLLHHGRGFVFTLFENKDKLQKEQSEQIDLQIDLLRQKIDFAEQEHLKNIDELNALFFPLSESIYSIKGNSANNLNRVDLIKAVLENPKDVIYLQGYNTYRLDASTISNRRASMESDPEYSRRRKALENRTTNYKRIMDSIKKLEKEKLHLSILTIQELITHLNAEIESKFWDPKLPPYEPQEYAQKIKNSKSFNLLKYLIRNGYIDENYAAYVSYFYPNSLTVQDRNFLLALSDRAPLEYGYQLDHPETILDRLNISDFTRRELRNFNLLSYLIRHQYGAQLHTWLQACDSDPDAYHFLVQFWHFDNMHSDFIRIVYKEQPKWFHEWVNDGILQGDERRSFLLDILMFLDSEQLQTINSENWITTEISTDPDFLKIDEPNIPILISAFKTLTIQFQSIDYRKQDVNLLQAVYQENLYALNLSTLKLFMKIYWNIPYEEAESRSYSHIFHRPEESLSKRIFDSVDSYLRVILQESSTNFSDDEDAVCDLLNHKDLEEEYKLAYIQRMNTTLQSINSIEIVSLWRPLIENNCVKFTWENIADYFAALEQDIEELTDELEFFIDSDTSELNWNFTVLNNRIGSENAERLRRAILSNQNISIERFRSALAGMTLQYPTGFPLTNIANERMRIIFDLKIVPMTEQNVEVIRKSYPQLWCDFVFFSGLRALLKLIRNERVTLTAKEIADLLEDRRITSQNAINLIDSFSGTIPLQNRSYPPLIKAKIIQEHFVTDEISILFQSFEEEPPHVCEAFLQYAKEHTGQIVLQAKEIRYIPVKIYSNCLSGFTESQARVLRPYLSNKNFEIVCTENKNPKFVDTPENRNILNFFKNQNWISNYKIEKDFIRAFSTRK